MNLIQYAFTFRKDCFISSKTDKYLAVKEYKTFEEFGGYQKFEDMARIIQRCYRAYKFLRNIKLCAQHYRKLQEQCKQLKLEKEANER